MNEKKVVIAETAIGKELVECSRYAKRIPDRKIFADFAEAVEAVRKVCYLYYIGKATENEAFSAIRAMNGLVGKVQGKNFSALERTTNGTQFSTLFLDCVRLAVRDYTIVTDKDLAHAILEKKQLAEAVDNAKSIKALAQARKAVADKQSEIDKLFATADKAYNSVKPTSKSTYYAKLCKRLASIAIGRACDSLDEAKKACDNAKAENNKRNKRNKAERKTASKPEAKPDNSKPEASENK